MAVRIKFTHEDNESMKTRLNEVHNALKGSPAYKENEIALCEMNETEFVLVVGEDNGNDCAVTV